MKKKNARRLTLRRETLNRLDAPTLAELVGGEVAVGICPTPSKGLLYPLTHGPLGDPGKKLL